MAFIKYVLILVVLVYIQFNEKVVAESYWPPAEYITDPAFEALPEVTPSLMDPNKFTYTISQQYGSPLPGIIQQDTPLIHNIIQGGGHLDHKGLLASLFSPISWLFHILLLPIRILRSILHL